MTERGRLIVLVLAGGWLVIGGIAAATCSGSEEPASTYKPTYYTPESATTPTPSTPSYQRETPREHAKPHCSKGCPCGNSCIDCSKTCHH